MKRISEKRKLIFITPVDLTSKDTAKKLSELVAGDEAAKLPPFKEWLEKFSEEKKESLFLYHYKSWTPAKVDENYFNDVMELVGRRAKLSLEKSFSDYQTKEKSKKFRFSVFWHGADREEISCSTLGKKGIEIQLWHDLPKVAIDDSNENTNALALRVQMEKSRKKKAALGLCYQVSLITALVGLIFLVLSNKVSRD